MRPLRRCGEISPGLARSGFGQASSNDAGGGSAVPTAAARWAAWGEGPATTDPAAAARWSAPGRARALFATSRKTADCASAWADGLGRLGLHRLAESDARAWRPRPATAAVTAERQRRRGSTPPASRGLLIEREAGRRRTRHPASTARRKHRPHRGLAARLADTPPPSRRAMFFNSRTAIQSPSMIAPVQTPITPAMISVLPVLNSLIGIP